MSYALPLTIAYVATGTFYVWHKLAESNYLRVPPNLLRYRQDRNIGRPILTGMTWPLATLLNREFGYGLIFVALTAVGLYLSGI